MKVLIADKFDASGISALKKEKMEVISNPELDGETLVEALKQHKPQVLVVRSTKVQAAMLDACDTLSLVIRAGAGVNTIDLDHASKLGVFVANCPGKNSVAVAELTLGLMLAVDRHIAAGDADLKSGRWNKKTYSKADGLKGKTFGLVGVGNIGKEVIQRIHSFDMPIIAWSRSLTDEKAEELGIKRMASPKEVAQNADIVSVHVALNQDTRGLCNAEFFSSMQKGAFFLNTSRAEVVDENALIEAMDSKGVRAGLDVFADEPSAKACDWQTNLTRHPQVVGTHHIGASTEQAQQAIADETLRIIQTFHREGIVLNCVNLNKHPETACVLTARHMNQVGVLAQILGAIQEENINVLEMENALFSGDQAAIAKIALNKAPSPEAVQRIRESNKAIISLNVLQ